MTKETFHRGMTLLAATWPTREPTKDTLEAYWLVLQDIADQVFELAIEDCLRHSKFYPVPAEIIERAEAAKQHPLIQQAEVARINAEVAQLRASRPDLLS